MPSDDTPFEATDESSLIVVRALSDAIETQHPSVGVTSRALLAELADQSSALEPQYRMLASADVNCDTFFKYPCIAQVIEKTGYTANLLVHVLRDLSDLKMEVLPEQVGQRSIVSARSMRFRIFDIIEIYTMQTADGRYQAPQWAVRLGQWANWLLTPQARVVLGQIARAALSLDDLETYRMTIKLGEYVHFVLHTEKRENETRVPLLNILAEVSSVSVLEMRDRQHEAQLAEIIKKFNAAATALRAEGLCNIRLLRTGAGEMAAQPADNDNRALLADSFVTISAAG